MLGPLLVVIKVIDVLEEAAVQAPKLQRVLNRDARADRLTSLAGRVEHLSLASRPLAS